MQKFFIFIILLISCISITYAWQGCCSWHWGEDYCGSDWMWQCNDWTESPSCSCSSSYNAPTYTPPTIICWLNSYSYLWKCICYAWYTWQYPNISTNYDCILKPIVTSTCWVNSYLSSNWKCVCYAWYTWQYPNISTNYDCILKPIVTCWVNSYSSNWSCVCNAWYTFNSTTNSCVLPTQSCQTDYWIHTYSKWPANIDTTYWQYNCYCYPWYEWNSSKTSCISIPTLTPTQQCQAIDWTNSYSDWTMTNNWSYNCYCNNGYMWDNNQKSCMATTTQNCQSTYGYNSYMSWNSCYCNAGYIRNNNQTSCVKVTTTSCQSTYWYNSYMSWNSCYCTIWNSNMTRCLTPTTASCQSTYGYNSSLSWNNCSCKEGYIWNNDWTSCILWTNINTGTTEDINIGSDAVSGSELSDAILWMYNNWLTNYSSVTDFMWNSYLTREQATKFFVKFNNRLWKNDTANIKNRFIDIKNATPDLIPYISNVYSMGIMNWKKNRFMPFDNLTQAQAIAVIVRMINWKENENGPQWYNEYYNIVANTWKILDGLWFDYSTLDSTNILRGDMALLIYRASKW